jgi:hypothetical protein
MNTTSENITQVIVVGLLAGLVFGILAWRSSRFFARCLLGMVAAALLIPSSILFLGRNPWIIDARYRTFQLFYWNIRMDMSRQEVIAEMRNWYPTDQPRMLPKLIQDSADKMEFQMNPESETAQDHEGIILKMLEGRVVDKSYETE